MWIQLNDEKKIQVMNKQNSEKVISYIEKLLDNYFNIPNFYYSYYHSNIKLQEQKEIMEENKQQEQKDIIEEEQVDFYNPNNTYNIILE